MLDRLSLSLVSLPESTYDVILILTDADNTRTESQRLIGRDILKEVVKALKPGGRLRSQDGAFASTESEERREAILAGLVVATDNKDGVTKPNYDATQSVPLRFGKKKSEGSAAASTIPAGTGVVSLNLNGKRKNGPPGPTQPSGVGFVDFSDDFDAPIEEENSDDELIDEDTLLDDSDLARPIIQRTSLTYHPHAPPPKKSLTNLAQSTRMPPHRPQKTPPRLQRLHLRSRPKTRRRRHRQALRRRPDPRQAQSRRPRRGGFHRPGQSRQLRQLCTGRCFPLRWLSLRGLTGF